MATRAVIKIEGVNFAQIYKHWDGYPEATLPWLEAFNSSFEKERSNDPAYKFAQLLRDSVVSEKKFRLDESRTTGWGVTNFNGVDNHDYEYLLKSDGTVVVNPTNFDDDNQQKFTF